MNTWQSTRLLIHIYDTIHCRKQSGVNMTKQLTAVIEREGDGFSVTQFPTDLANENINEIYYCLGLLILGNSFFYMLKNPRSQVAEATKQHRGFLVLPPKDGS